MMTVDAVCDGWLVVAAIVSQFKKPFVSYDALIIGINHTPFN